MHDCYFEKEGSWTMDSKGELFITIISGFAQEKSRSIFENDTGVSGSDLRMARSVFLTDIFRVITKVLPCYMRNIRKKQCTGSLSTNPREPSFLDVFSGVFVFLGKDSAGISPLRSRR